MWTKGKKKSQRTNLRSEKKLENQQIVILKTQQFPLIKYNVDQNLNSQVINQNTRKVKYWFECLIMQWIQNPQKNVYYIYI